MMEQVRQWLVRERREEAPDAVTLALAPVAGAMPLYLPGQYLTLLFEVYGEAKRRAYSLSSAPGIDDPLLHITIKRIPNGEFSTRLVQRTQIGDVLDAVGPSGRFLLPNPLPDTLVYIAGGSGITPVISHLKWLLARPAPPDILLMYANRDAAHTLFKNTLDAWAQRFPGKFHLRYVFSREKHSGGAFFGHLSQMLLEHILQDHFSKKQLEAARYFICAPTGIQRMTEMTLRVMDVPESHLHHEQFTPDPRLKRRIQDTSRKHLITIQDAGIRFETFHNETILNAALRRGIALPYTCKSGVCFSCLQKLTKGEVDIVFVDNTLRAKPGDLVNTCIGYAVSPEVTIASNIE